MVSWKWPPEKESALARAIVPQLIGFTSVLASESERSAVVLGAERLHVALEFVLKSFLKPSPNREDKLFERDGALSTFSRKTEMAYRIGLVTLRFKRSLDLVRNLRNDFAHALKVEKLSQQNHSNRVMALYKLTKEGNEANFQRFFGIFGKAEKHTQIYLTCILLLILKLEMQARTVKRIRNRFPARVP